MRRFVLITLLATGLVAWTAGPALAQVTIDNFTSPSQGSGGTDYLTISGPIGSSDTFVQGGVDALGGTRVYYGQKTNSDASTVQLGIGNNQAFRFVQNPVASGRAKLLYGYSAVAGASLDTNNYLSGHTLASLNLDVSGNGLSLILLDYSLGGNSSTGTLTVTLISNSETTPQQANVTLPIASTGFSTLAFLQQAFLANNPNVSFADIDQIIVSMDGTPGGVNAGIDNIRIAAIPEPATWALGVMGVAGLGGAVYRRVAARRRRRQRAKLAKQR